MDGWKIIKMQPDLFTAPARGDRTHCGDSILVICTAAHLGIKLYFDFIKMNTVCPPVVSGIAPLKLFHSCTPDISVSIATLPGFLLHVLMSSHSRQGHQLLQNAVGPLQGCLQSWACWNTSKWRHPEGVRTWSKTSWSAPLDPKEQRSYSELLLDVWTLFSSSKPWPPSWGTSFQLYVFDLILLITIQSSWRKVKAFTTMGQYNLIRHETDCPSRQNDGRSLS